MGRFDGRTAIVTGAAQGIGEAYARALAAEGANVVVADLNRELGEAVAKQITADGGSAVFKDVDVLEHGTSTVCRDLLGDSFTEFAIEVRHDHVGPLRGQSAGIRLSDTLRCSGDYRGATVETSHVDLLSW